MTTYCRVIIAYHMHATTNIIRSLSDSRTRVNNTLIVTEILMFDLK